MKLSDAMTALRSTSDQTHKFWAYFQAFTAAGVTLAWLTTIKAPVIIGFAAGFCVFAHFNRRLVVSSQADAAKIWKAIQAYVDTKPDDLPDQLKEITTTNEPDDPKRIKKLHWAMTIVAVVVMLVRIPFL
jgi:hypothetical protein